MLFTRTSALAIGASLFAVCQAAFGDWKPSKTVEIVIASSPGAGTDRTGRWIQKLLSEKKLLEVPVSVVNKPGGGTMVAVNYIGQHAGDGHLFLLISTSIVTAHIVGRSPQTHADVTSLAILGIEPIAFAVRADSTLKSARDLADRFKADAAGVSVGFANALGNQNHLAVAKVVKRLDGNVKGLKAVVFNGSADVTTALLGGHVDLAITSGSALVSLIESGKVRALAMSGEQRVGGAYAAVPTWKELGIDAVTTNWRAIVGPKGMTEDQVAFWNQVFSKLVQLPEWKQDLEKLLVTNTYLNSRDTRRFLDAEYAAFSSFLTEVGLARKP
jgi:putative tricarboxylic transport membrane protein